MQGRIKKINGSKGSSNGSRNGSIKGAAIIMMQYQSEAAKLFQNEVREKKRTASGVHHKTGKNGYVGTMRFPSDIMSRSEKMRYRRNGKVMTTNMYEEIMTVEAFEDLETYEQKNRLQYWRNTYTNKEITEKMGISNKRFYDFVKDLDLPKAPRIDREKPRKAAAKKIHSDQAEKITPPAPVAAIAVEEKPIAQEVIIDGLHLVFNGSYKAEIIQKMFSKIDMLLEDEEDEFYIESEAGRGIAENR